MRPSCVWYVLKSTHLFRLYDLHMGTKKIQYEGAASAKCICWSIAFEEKYDLIASAFRPTNMSVESIFKVSHRFLSPATEYTAVQYLALLLTVCFVLSKRMVIMFVFALKLSCVCSEYLGFCCVRYFFSGVSSLSLSRLAYSVDCCVFKLVCFVLVPRSDVLFHSYWHRIVF